MAKRSHVLVSPARSTSFYESFSDLIFGTLVLFIVMVMAIAVKLQEASAALTAEVDAVVFPNRFVGGSSIPLMHIALFPLDRETYVCWVPDDIAREWDYRRQERGINPILRLCEHATSVDGLALMSADEFRAAAPGLGRVVAEGWNTQEKIGRIVAMIEALRRGDPARFGRMTAVELYERLGGLFADSEPSAALRGTSQSHQTWFRRNTGKVPTAVAETVLALGPPAEEPYSVIRFAERPDSGYAIGGATLSAARFRGLLRAITPGRGFRIEHVDAQGEPSAPSEKALAEVLRPVGFDRRVLTKRAEKILQGRRASPPEATVPGTESR